MSSYSLNCLFSTGQTPLFPPLLFQKESVEGSRTRESVGKSSVIFLLFFQNANLIHEPEKAAVEKFSWLILLRIGLDYIGNSLWDYVPQEYGCLSFYVTEALQHTESRSLAKLMWPLAISRKQR